MPLSQDTTFRTPTDIAWDFSGQVVLVTGAAHGQGAVHAETFAAAGADVVISDIAGEMKYVDYPLGTVRELDDVTKGIRAGGRRCLSTVCDVRRPEQVEAMVKAAIEEFGRIDIAISNAGIGSVNPVVKMPEDEWSETFDTDLSGGFYLCKYVAPHMIEAGYGRILVTGSTQSLGGTNWISHYTAAKHGLVGLVKGFAPELAEHGVTINLVCPTAVDTRINEPFVDPKYSGWITEATRLVGAWNLLLEEGMMHEREVSEAMMWLASREAANVNGTTLMVDGGCTAK
jgi:NAD(P)-dependent dehydrogenase (short-subunit alcohol dehydrogenase family)